MLKLSSNHAKSYIRDTAAQQTERTKITGSDRFLNVSSECDFEASKKSMRENQFRREKYDYRQPLPTSDLKSGYGMLDATKTAKQKPYGYSYQNGSNLRNQQPVYRQDWDDVSRKSKKIEENMDNLGSNFRDKSPRVIPSKRSNVSGSYQFDLPSQSDQNYDPDSKNSKYSKYLGRGTLLQSNFAIEKKQYAAKHSRRNQQVKNRILKEQNYSRDFSGKSPYEDRYEKVTAYDNYLNDGTQPYENYRNQQDFREPKQDYQNIYKNSRRLQFETFQKSEDWKTDRQQRTNNYDISNQSPYQEDVNMVKKNSEDYIQDRFDRPSFNERKQPIKKSIEGTPQKNYRGKFEPGSAERKNSLIEKSQMLQQKLKKLNIQYPGGEREKNNGEQAYQPQRPVSRIQTPQQNEEVYSRYTPSHAQVSITNRSNSCLRNNFKNISIAQGQRDIQSTNRQNESLRTKSPINDSQNGVDISSKGEVFDKIAKLNEKINERIQSIISNYAKK